MQRLFTLLILPASVFAAPASPNARHVLLDVQAAAAPVPALKYQLLPEVGEMNPGNAVPAYLKCFFEQNNFFFKKESVDERERLLICPLTDIKPGSLKGYGGNATTQADYAARLEYCDWNILPQMREKGYALLLPDIQQMRMLPLALAVRCRGQLVDKDFDGAVHTLKTMFALARHMGDHPTLISGLVGAAIGKIALNVLEELIQQPGAPNLYWALTGMPTQLVDLRRAASGERMLMEASFGTLMDIKRIWGPDDVADAMKKATEVGYYTFLAEEDRKAAEQWLRDRIRDEGWLKAARKSLAEAGYPVDKLDKYPPEQVVFYYLQRKSRIQQDELLKWMNVPYWQAESALEELTNDPIELEDKLTRSIVFRVAKVRAAHLRLEQRFALLRVVEAIRMDAAKNGGKLPVKLSDLISPLPNDPATGKAFNYKIDGMTAILTGTPTKATAGNSTHSYEVRLRK